MNARCPHCSKSLNFHDPFPIDGSRGRPARAGDYTICAGCAEILCFKLAAGGGVELRATTSAELATLPGSSRGAMHAAQQFVRHFVSLTTPAAPATSSTSDQVREAHAYELTRQLLSRVRS